MSYHPREIEPKLKEYLGYFPVVAVTGPRQSGKSTLLLHTLKNYTYVNFDDSQTRQLFYHDPEQFMRIYANEVIFDEAQKVPELFERVKIAVDNDRDRRGKFVLTGSSQFSFIKGISESLAGRIGLLTLLPYQFNELPDKDRSEAIYKGSYPELVNKHYQLSADWFSSYIDTYLTKDVTALGNIGDLRDFQMLIQLLAANTAQVLNMSRFASDLGVDVKTIKRWISILEASYIIFLLPPYYKNYGKRIVKRPKIYFYDTGLVSYLTGIQTKEQFELGPLKGSLFENYVIADILKKELHHKTHAELYYLRTSHGVEVDLIIDRKNYKEFIEIKSTETFKPKMIEAAEEFMESDDKGYLLYRGKGLPALDKITIMNYQDYLARID